MKSLLIVFGFIVLLGILAIIAESLNSKNAGK